MTSSASVPSVLRAPAERDPAEELALLVRSRFPVVYLDSVEERRAEGLIAAAARTTGRRCWTWSISQGLVQRTRDTPRDVHQEGEHSAPVDALRAIARMDGDDVFVLLDMSRHVEESDVAERLVRDMARQGGKTVFLVGPHGEVPRGLRASVATVTLPRPDVSLIQEHLQLAMRRMRASSHVPVHLTDEDLPRLATSLRGLTLDQVDQVLLALAATDGRLDHADIPRAAKEAASMLATAGPVTLEHPELGLDWVAGLDDLKGWATSRAASFRPDAAAFGLSPPRGLLLTGVPGCGKSFATKAIAATWGLPLLRMDAGALFDMYIGSSERNLRDALGTAEALAPCILWIDEVEKGFGSQGPSSSDGGLGFRMLGTLATWMQEKDEPVAVIATSNDITKLPPELTRQGRFDEIFFFDLPDADAREHLFMLQLAQRGRDWSAFDCARLAEASDGYSGSEIEQAVTNALYVAFGAGRDVTTEDVLGELAATRPLSVVSATAIDEIRRWGQRHARPA